MTTEDPHVLLSALLDGEVVDPDSLAALLETPSGRDTLVDFVALRALVRDEDSLETRDRAPAAAVRRRPWRWTALGAAAALLFVVGLGSGAWWMDRRINEPPAPQRTVRFERGIDWYSGP